MTPFVFVSHADADKSRLRPLIEVLLDENIALWIDRPEELGLDDRFLRCGRIRSGADWQSEIDSALAKAACVLFVLSSESNRAQRSDSLFREFDAGLKRDSLVMVSIDTLDRQQCLPQFRLRQSRDLSALVAAGASAVRGLDRGTQARLQVVVQDLRALLKSSPGPGGESRDASLPEINLPRLLPYLTDRAEQQHTIDKVFKAAFDGSAHGALTFVAHGLEDDCLDSFVEQVRFTRLPRLLASHGLPQQVVFKSLCWNSFPATTVEDARDDDRSSGAVTEQIAEALQLPMTATTSDIVAHLSNVRACWYLQVNFDAETEAEEMCRSLQEWVAWWSAPALRGIGNPVITIACQSQPCSFFTRWAAARRSGRLRRAVACLGKEQKVQGLLHLLPPLRHLRFGDVEKAISQIDDDIDREVMRKQLRRSFALALLPFHGRSISMYRAAALLKRVLADPNVRVKGPT